MLSVLLYDFKRKSLSRFNITEVVFKTILVRFQALLTGICLVSDHNS